MAAIPSLPLLPVEEYIARFIDGNEKPSCEYVEGELFLRPMATKEHSRVQKNIIVAIERGYGERFEPLPELTAQLRETRFLIPDIAVQDREHPIQGRYAGPRDSVFLCVEIKSPLD
ncbi:MAG: Uma2 family endonuclease [Acidobacteriota bacterium]|nr:Uma2 family endonuclease [Acidobacteriota bacterium]